jgi:error-prone DNA polymerase
MADAETLIAEYAATGVSVQGHLMALHRDRAERSGAVPSRELKVVPAGGRVRVAGMVAVRQKCPTARRFVFPTLEDEEGMTNVIVRPLGHRRRTRSGLAG